MAAVRRVTALLASTAASVSATGILLPLYLYPSAEPNDGATNWKPALDAVAASAHVPWLVVVNPADGPGATGEPGNGDPNYISGVSQLNALSNVQTVGYVWTDYGAAPLPELEANITSWARWSSFSSSPSSEDTGGVENIGVDGIFFDEASAMNFEYLRSAVTHARTAFGSKQIVTVCNFGTAAAVEYYRICDVAIAFESFLNHPDFPAYKGRETLDANIPAGNYHAQAAVVVHDFAGAAYDGRVADVALLNSYAQSVRDAGLGWVYFCSGAYDSITTAPATIGALAAAF